MSKSDYGQYSILIALIPAAVMVGESGGNAILISFGARIMDHHKKQIDLLGSVLRHKLSIAFIVSIVVGIGGIALLLVAGGRLLPSILMSVIALLTILVTVVSATFQAWHQLHGNTRILRNAQMLAAASRAIALAMLVALSIMNPLTALIVGLSTALFTVFAYQRMIPVRKISKLNEDYAVKISLKNSAANILPMTVALVLAEQLVLILVTVHGGAQIVAEVSALMRFAIAFTVLNLFVADIITGPIARSNNRRQLSRYYYLVISGYLFISIVSVYLISIFSEFFLYLLGPQYYGLDYELVVMMSGASVLNLAYAIGFMNQARGWVKFSWLYIPFGIAWCTFGVMFLDLETALGGVLFMAGNALPALFMQGFRATAGFRTLDVPKS